MKSRRPACPAAKPRRERYQYKGCPGRISCFVAAPNAGSIYFVVCAGCRGRITQPAREHSPFFIFFYFKSPRTKPSTPIFYAAKTRRERHQYKGCPGRISCFVAAPNAGSIYFVVCAGCRGRVTQPAREHSPFFYLFFISKARVQDHQRQYFTAVVVVAKQRSRSKQDQRVFLSGYNPGLALKQIKLEESTGADLVGAVNVRANPAAARPERLPNSQNYRTVTSQPII